MFDFELRKHFFSKILYSWRFKKMKCEIIKSFTPLWLLLHTLHFGRNSNNTNPHCLVRNSFSLSQLRTKMKNWLRKFSSDQISGLLPLAIKVQIVELAKKQRYLLARILTIAGSCRYWRGSKASLSMK